MNKFLIPILVLAAAICLGASACLGIGYVNGSGPVANQTYDLMGFKNIEISNAFGFDITPSENFSVTISAHQNIIQYLDITKNGDTLIVRMKSGRYTNSETRAIITLPELISLKVSGASRGSVTGFKSSGQTDVSLSGASQAALNLEAGSAKVEISGASRVTGSLVTQETKFEISGASNCEIDGSSAVSSIGISGASRFNSPSFQMRDCTVNVSGASSARIFVSGTLNVEASGASSVKYSGEPKINGLKVTGASQVGSQ